MFDKAITYSYLAINFGAIGTIGFAQKGDDNVARNATGAAANCNDGELHVIMGVNHSATVHELWWDGALVGVNQAVLGAQTLDQGAVGALRRNTVVVPFEGTIYAAAAGWGDIPSPPELYLDWINGRFTGALLSAGASSSRSLLLHI